MSATHLELPYSIDAKNPFLLDKRSGPYASKAAANAGIPEAVRVQGLVVIVQDATVGYYYKDGIEDVDLVPINTDEYAIWGQISGSLADQTDLQAALNAKEDDIAPGTTLQYWRGDKTWQTLDTSNVPENGAVYFTQARARQSIDVTATGNSGAATYNNTTGIINIPQYTLAGLGGEPAITLGTSLQYWRGDKSWQTLNTDAVPEATAKYYTDARVLAYGNTQWPRLDGSYTNPSWIVSLPWSKVTNTPTTIAGYGITDAFTEAESDARYVKKAGDIMTGNLLIAAPASIDSTLVPGEDILNLGTANASVINIGWSGATINIQGSVMWQDVDNLAVTDKLIRLNKGGATASGVSSGFEIEENAVITGWFATDATRTGWDFKAPASQQLTLGLDLLTASRTIKMPNLTGTLLIDAATYNDPAWLATLAWSKITGTPTTLSGYGITNAYTKTEVDSLLTNYVPIGRQLTINGVAQDLSANRTWTVGDVRTDSSYSNPTWLTALAWSKITGTPTTLGGYGISDAYTQIQIQNFFSGASAITGYNKSNWDSVYNWYQTNPLAAYVLKSGDTMTGSLGFGATSGLGLNWGLNSDSAFIRFVSTGNGVGLSYLEIGTADDSDEQIIFTQSGATRVKIATDGFLKNGSDQRYVVEDSGARTWSINIGGNSAYATFAGNADTVDGFHADTFYRSIGFEGGGSNANTLLENRSAFTYANNAPWSGPILYVGASGYGFQINAQYGNGLNISYRVRNGDNTVWSDWREFIHTGNISAQSVNNSVLWNGQTLNNTVLGTGYSTQGIYVKIGTITYPMDASGISQFLGLGSNAFNSTAYLALSGGTMTGTITTVNGNVGIIVGDDSKLADRNVANTLFIEGFQNNDRGYINFSETSGNSLGAVNGGALTWRGVNVLTASNYNDYSPSLTGVNASGVNWNISILGNAATADQVMTYDERAISPNDIANYRVKFGMGTWANNLSTAVYSDFIHFRTYGDASAGNQNLIMFLKSGIGMRIYQGSWNSGSDYSSYVDVMDSGNQPYAWAMNQYVGTTSQPEFTALTIRGGASSAINFYGSYSGDPSHAGFTVTNRAGTITFSHNANGGGSYLGGPVTVVGIADFNGQVNLNSSLFYAPSNYSSGGFSRILGRNATTGRIEGMSSGDIAAFISGTYLPLSGGTLTGNLNGTTAYFSGNVGIGVSPSAQLDVANVIRISGGNSSYYAEIRGQFSIQSGFLAFRGGGGSGMVISSEEYGSQTAIWANNSEYIRITGDGLISLGSTLSGTANQNSTNTWTVFRGVSLFDGSANYGSYGGILLNTNNEYTTSARRFLITNAFNANNFAIIRSIGATTNPSLGTAGSISSGTADFIITNTGNIGVGFASPLVKFTVISTNYNSLPTLGSGSVGTQALLSVNGLYGMYSGVSSSGDVWHQVQRNDASPVTYNLLLQPSGGNVGIGVSATSQKLHIGSTGVARILIENTDNQATGAGLQMLVTNGGSVVGNATLRVDNLGNIALFNGTSSVAENFKMLTTGQATFVNSLNIGTALPIGDRMLQVSGTATSSGLNQFMSVFNTTFSGTISNAWGVYVGNNFSTGAITNSYNLYVEATNIGSATVTNRYGIYQVGSLDKNYFAGDTNFSKNVSIGTAIGIPLPYLNGVSNSFGYNSFLVNHNNSDNTALQGGLILSNSNYAVGAYSPIIAFTSRSATGTYNGTYAAIYGVNAGPGDTSDWSAGHIILATSNQYGPVERFRITSSGNAGLGTSTPNFTETNRRVLDINGPSSSGIGLSAGGNLYGYLYANNGVALMGTNGNIPLELQSNSTTRVIIKGDGNMGLGVNPKDWISSFRVFQIGGSSSSAFIYGRQDTNIEGAFGINAYYDATGWKYTNTGAASQYTLIGGIHAWYTAASGTAGTAISWTNHMSLSPSLFSLTVPITGTSATFTGSIGSTGLTVSGSGTIVVQGGASGAITLYSAYSGDPSHPGMVITNRAGAVTFSHNANGGATYINGDLTVTGNISSTTEVGLNIAGYSKYLVTSDIRIISPSVHPAGRLSFGFTSYSNNNTSPWADYLHFRSYSDASGGSDNLLMIRKEGLGMRLWQQSWGSSTAYSTYVDIIHSGNISAYGVTSITGTANQVIASASVGAVTLSLPQNIATTSDVTFNLVTTNTHYNLVAGTGNGVRFWSSDAYKISMGVGDNYQYGPVIDYSIKMQMDSGSTGRGFTWGKEGVVPIAALNATSGNFQTAGTMTATKFTESSDRTLKTPVHENFLLPDIHNVKGHLYTKNGVLELGYYAQEVQPYLPHAVSTDGKHLNLSYREVFVAKISSLEDRTEQLERKVKELETELAKYKTQ